MKEIDLLKKALYEDENSIFQQDINAQIENSLISFSGTASYTGDSKIALVLKVIASDAVKNYISKEFSEITEEQFDEACSKIKIALEKSLEEFSLLLENKLASYGLTKGE